MGFLDQYLAKHQLDKMSDKHQNNVQKIEAVLNDAIKSSGTANFDDCLKQYGPQIADLVERVSTAIAQLPTVSWSFSSIAKVFRFVNSITVEVYQVVESMSNCVVNDKMTTDEKHTAKKSFGVNLVLFVWTTIDPLKNKFSWLPFKKTIENALVKLLAGMALESTVDLFAVSAKQIKISSFVKAV